MKKADPEAADRNVFGFMCGDGGTMNRGKQEGDCGCADATALARRDLERVAHESRDRQLEVARAYDRREILELAFYEAEAIHAVASQRLAQLLEAPAVQMRRARYDVTRSAAEARRARLNVRRAHEALRDLLREDG